VRGVRCSDRLSDELFRAEA